MFPARIETGRLVLRELREEDWALMHEYASDPEISRYETWGPNSEEQSREFLRLSMESRLEDPRRTFELAITLKSTGRLIGGAGIHVRDPAQLGAYIGYALRRDHWGQGLGTEAAAALIDFGFRRLELHRIWATCHVENVASSRVLEKAGMRREGRLVRNCLQRGEWRDSYLYAILEDERAGQLRSGDGLPGRAYG